MRHKKKDTEFTASFSYSLIDQLANNVEVFNKVFKVSCGVTVTNHED